MPAWWLALSPDNKTLAYGSWRVRFWDMSAGRETGSLPEQNQGWFALSPDGRTLAGCGHDNNVINVWEVAGRRLVRRLEVDVRKEGLEWIGYQHLAFSPGGKVLAACGFGRANDGRHAQVIHLWDCASGRIVRRLDFKEDEHCQVESATFSPDGKVLVALGHTTKGTDASGNFIIVAAKVRLWETATGQELSPQTAAVNAVDDLLSLRQGYPHPPPHITFSPDGRLLAKGRLQNGISVWDALTGRERCRLDGPTICVAFALDGRTLASAGQDGTIRLWDVERAKELKRLPGHRGKVNALTFTSDGATLISGGDDTTVLFWDVAAVTRRGREREPLAAGQWEPLWADLAGADAAAAHRAMARLAAAPEVTLPALKQRLRPAPAADPDRLARLLRDLDADEFAVREKATQQLERLGESARPALLRERDRTGAGAEVRKRLDGLLAGLAVPAGERLRELRAVEVLERVGDAEARRLLEALARGESEACLTREARAAADRLARRVEK